MIVKAAASGRQWIFAAMGTGPIQKAVSNLDLKPCKKPQVSKLVPWCNC